MVIMANYTNMVINNKKKHRDLATNAIGLINEMLDDGEKVTVAELVRRLGCCRAYFYTNEEVHNALIHAQELQTGKVFIKPQKAILDEATKRENTILKQKVAFLEQQLLQEKHNQKTKADQEFDQIANL